MSLRLPVAGAFSARIDAKNLLDAPYRTTQGTVTREDIASDERCKLASWRR